MIIGDRVRIIGTLLYNGRTGVLHANSGQSDDPWDFNVLLEPDANHDQFRRIGVFEDQVEIVDENA